MSRNNAFVRVRLASTKDAHRIAPLLVPEAHREACGLPVSENAELLLAQSVREELSLFWQGEGYSAYFVALADRDLAGCIRLTVHNAPVPYEGKIGTVSRLAVLPEYRGQWIAPKLMSAVRQMAEAAGATRIRAFTSLEHRSPERLYRKMGLIPYVTELYGALTPEGK